MKTALELTARIADSYEKIQDLECTLKTNKTSLHKLAVGQWQRVVDGIRAAIGPQRYRQGQGAPPLSFQVSGHMWRLTSRVLRNTDNFDKKQITREGGSIVYTMTDDQFYQTVPDGASYFQDVALAKRFQLGHTIKFNFNARRRGSLQVYFPVLGFNPTMPKGMQETGIPL